jgi:hypothetical protein
MAVVNDSEGWRLPTMEELVLMYRNLKQKGLDSFTDAWYCSSAEVGALPFFLDATYALRFTDGYQLRSGKGSPFRIRAVRQF